MFGDRERWALYIKGLGILNHGSEPELYVCSHRMRIYSKF